MIASPPPDLWPLDDFVAAANAALPGVLPDAPVVRIERTVTPRLVRYLTTQGVLSEPHKAGREARYDRRHLLDLLAVRRLMALGHTVAAIGSTVRGGSEGDAEAMLTGAIEVTSSEAAPDGMGTTDTARTVSAAPPGEAMSVGESAVDFLRGLGDPGASGAWRRDRSGVSASMAQPPGSSTPNTPPSYKPSRRAGTAPELWKRVEIGPGIDLHVRDDAHLPASPVERERLAARILDLLRALGSP